MLNEIRRWRVMPDRLRHWAQSAPDKRLFRCGGDWLSVGEVDQITDAVAGALHAQGVAKGDRVAILLPNCEEYVLSILAVAKLGAIQVPLNIYLKGEFLRHQLADSGSSVLIADSSGLAEVAKRRDDLPDLRLTVTVVKDGERTPAGAIPFADIRAADSRCPAVQIAPRDTAAIFYTSGTTGPAKGCAISHGYYAYFPWGWFENDWIRTDDRMLSMMPLFHTAGQGFALVPAILAGAELTIATTFSASGFLDECRRSRATTAFGVGAMGMAILATPEGPADRDNDLRAAIFPPMALSDRTKFERRFGATVVSDGYGQTECNPLAMSPLVQQGELPGSLGKPVPYLDVALVDENDMPVPTGEVGEIVVRPREPMVIFDGYWDNAAATVKSSRNLWHHTGDRARLGEDGRLTFVDRNSDSMRRRGENISSTELERAIAEHHKIAAVATHGVPSPFGEDDVKAWIVTAPGASFTPEELHEFFVAGLPYFAIPRYVEFIDELPVNALGRVTKFELRAKDNSAAWDFEMLNLAVSKGRRRSSSG
jgi:carnitine-CoA ligase